MTLYKTAHALADKGIPVFPCVANEKRPLTGHGLNDATTDHSAIDVWARRWPQANLAVPTGYRSGRLVLDLDRKDGRDGLASLAALECDLGKLPDTLIATTPSGGQHRFFRMPEVTIRSSAGKVSGAEAPGFDVRAEGGYVLVAPSIVGGQVYRWTARAPVADLPAQWVGVLARQVEPPQVPADPWKPRDEAERSRVRRWCVRALQQEARDLAASPVGTRNDQLWRSAAALGGLVHLGAIDAEDVRRALTWACSAWGTRTPLKDRQTLENGLRFGVANPRGAQIGDDRAA